MKETKAEKMAGMKIGNMTVIGDTGKRTKGRDVIVLTVDEKGKYHEVLSNNLFSKRNTYTGWVGSKEQKRQASILGRKSIKKVHKKVIFDGINLSNLSKEEMQINGATGYRGVFWDENKKRWSVSVQTKKETVLNKTFKDFSEAVLERNRFFLEEINPILKKNGFKEVDEIKEVVKNDYVLQKEKELKDYDELLSIKSKLNGLETIKKSKGVSFKKDKKKWKAYARENNKQKHLGYFETEEEAIKAKQDYIKTVVEPQIKQLKEIIKHDNI